MPPSPLAAACLRCARPRLMLTAAPKSPPVLDQRRHASFSLPSISSFFRRPSPASTSESGAPKQSEGAGDKGQNEIATGKGLFDVATEDETVQEVVQGERREKKFTYHKSSTANFKTSKRRLNVLSRLIAGRGVDEGVLQLQVSHKKPASRLLSMLALARDHAIAKGLSRDKLVIAQSWVTQGPSLARLDIKGRGRRGIKHHPSSKLHVLLAEGKTDEEKRRARKREQWRASIRGVGEADAIGVGRAKRMINVGVGGWRW